MAGSVAKNVIGRLHLEQIRTGGLSFATQIIAKMPKEGGHNRRMLRGVISGRLLESIGIWRGYLRTRQNLSCALPRQVVNCPWRLTMACSELPTPGTAHREDSHIEVLR